MLKILLYLQDSLISWKVPSFLESKKLTFIQAGIIHIWQQKRCVLATGFCKSTRWRSYPETYLFIDCLCPGSFFSVNSSFLVMVGRQVGGVRRKGPLQCCPSSETLCSTNCKGPYSYLYPISCTFLIQL